MIHWLWLIPVLPLLAAGISALLPGGRRPAAAVLAIGAMGASFALSLAAFASTLGATEGPFREVRNFDWLTFGHTTLQLGWILDPLTAVMLVMVTGVGLLIFIYSTGYMREDGNFGQFFCFLSLFAAALLGLLIANSLLLLFICWELVGLASYLLIGFWFFKPEAAAAAKKAFITTRVGDMGLLLGMVWLYSRAGTLLFYDQGRGCLESAALHHLATLMTGGGLAVSTAVSLLIFCGAVGKSGQLPLHTWLPDAMEGPTPVSALIHAATMVAAGVFLVARVYPLMAAGLGPQGVSTALEVVTWVGAATALFAACVAVAQDDIKRILAYSTVSQLGYMMMGLGTGGVAVGMFHLLTHAFFKALLFLGAGSVILGCHHEQDIRKMGGLRKLMPVTFAAYAVGTMALCGVPLLFSGFWSKDAILHEALNWKVSSAPFFMGLTGAALTAFYMTRQVCYVFFGRPAPGGAHESPPVMTIPLALLAVMAVVAGFFGTPAWPWFDSYLAGERTSLDLAKLLEGGTAGLMLLSAAVVGVAIWTAADLYGKAAAQEDRSRDPLAVKQPALFNLLRRKFYFDEIYDATIVRLNHGFALLADFLDLALWSGAVALVAGLAQALGWLSKEADDTLVNGGFDGGCETLRQGGKLLGRGQNGQTQRYLRVAGAAAAALALLAWWRSR